MMRKQEEEEEVEDEEEEREEEERIPPGRMFSHADTTVWGPGLVGLVPRNPQVWAQCRFSQTKTMVLGARTCGTC